MSEKESTKERGYLKILYLYKILFEHTDSANTGNAERIRL